MLNVAKLFGSVTPQGNPRGDIDLPEYFEFFTSVSSYLSANSEIKETTRPELMEISDSMSTDYTLRSNKLVAEQVERIVLTLEVTMLLKVPRMEKAIRKDILALKQLLLN